MSRIGLKNAVMVLVGKYCMVNHGMPGTFWYSKVWYDAVLVWYVMVCCVVWYGMM